MINKQNLLWQAFGLLPFLILAACSTDDAPGSGTDAELVPVTIRLDVENSGVQTRAEEGSAEIITDDSEIHTLDVSIISNGTEELHLTKDDFIDNVAEVELSAGEKTIRAVANAGDNPASPLDATALISAENGIPMSTTQDTTWNVTASQSEYEVRLNRMVGQIEVTLNDERKGENLKAISSVTISGLPETTNLYRAGYGKITLPTNVNMDGSWEWTNISGTTQKSFYLHETNQGGTVTVKVGNDERTGNFSTPIPRNYILPLIVHITDFSLAISGTYTYAPIGVQPIEAKIVPNGYRVSLPEGSSDITLTIKLKNNTSGENEITSGVSWNCELPTEADIYFDANPSGENSSLVLTADAIPALSGDNWVIPITATYNKKDYQFSLTIAVEALTRSGAGKQSEGPVIIEL